MPDSLHQEVSAWSLLLRTNYALLEEFLHFCMTDFPHSAFYFSASVGSIKQQFVLLSSADLFF